MSTEAVFTEQGSRCQQRDHAGRYSSTHSAPVLLEAVPEVARLVAARLDKDPHEVTQREWNTGRRAVAAIYGHLPQAHQVCCRLADRYGRSWPWSDLLDVTLDPNRDAKKTYEERLSEPDRVITHHRVRWALRYIAHLLGRDTLLPHEYEEMRAELLAGKDGVVLKPTLPSRGQIETASGGWDQALDIAGLAQRPTSVNGATTQDAALKTIATKEAIVAFHADNGRYPTRDELDSYLHTRSHALPDGVHAQWWDELPAAEDAINYLHESGALSAPAREEPTDWRVKYTHVDVVRAVLQFISEGHPLTDKQWRAFQRGRDGIPSLNVIKNHGGLRNIAREAAHPDWLERAKQWDTVKPAKAERPQGRPLSEKRDLIFDAIKQHGEIGIAGLIKELSLPRDQVRYYLRELKAKGLIEPTQLQPNARKQAYRIRPS